MNLYTGKFVVNPDERGPVLGWRRALRVGWLYLEWGWDCVFSIDDEPAQWSRGYGVDWVVSITRHFFIGRDHHWYDGSWCFLSLGWVHFLRRDRDCPECEAEA